MKNIMIMKIVIIIVLAMGLYTFLAYVWMQGQVTNNQCKDYCEEKDALTFQRLHSGKWDLYDPCICYYEHKIETIILNKK